MPGDCAWLENREWAVDYPERRASLTRLAEHRAKVERDSARWAVEHAVGVLGADAVVDLVNALRAAASA